jgi:MFS family permease
LCLVEVIGDRATALFGLIADGLWSATLIWGLAGIGFAGAYMPGLKALADRLAGGDSSRSITLYTGSFSIGVGLSFLVSQLVADGAGWRSTHLPPIEFSKLVKPVMAGSDHLSALFGAWQSPPPDGRPARTRGNPRKARTIRQRPGNALNGSL